MRSIFFFVLFNDIFVPLKVGCNDSLFYFNHVFLAL